MRYHIDGAKDKGYRAQYDCCDNHSASASSSFDLVVACYGFGWPDTAV